MGCSFLTACVRASRLAFAPRNKRPPPQVLATCRVARRGVQAYGRLQESSEGSLTCFRLARRASLAGRDATRVARRHWWFAKALCAAPGTWDTASSTGFGVSLTAPQQSFVTMLLDDFAQLAQIRELAESGEIVSNRGSTRCVSYESGTAQWTTSARHSGRPRGSHGTCTRLVRRRILLCLLVKI